MSFTPAQVDQLLHPINVTRVLRDGKGHSHVSQQDILAHLIRVFGFGNFDITVLSTECIFEAPRDNPAKFDVCYRALVRLTLRNPSGDEVCHYENGSTATAQNQSRGDAHDLAYKSAISLSVKRAAIALGDQFGLSLYNKGQMEALVRGTLVTPSSDPWATSGAAKGDVQEGVPQQVSLGNDEIDKGEDVAPAAAPPAPKPETAPESPYLNPQGKLAKRMFALMGDAGITDRELRLAFVAETVGREIGSSKEMTDADAEVVIKRLEGMLDRPFDPPEGES